jgi:hypothetical protein
MLGPVSRALWSHRGNRDATRAQEAFASARRVEVIAPGARAGAGTRGTLAASEAQRLTILLTPQIIRPIPARASPHDCGDRSGRD